VYAESVLFQIYVPGNRILNKVVARTLRNTQYYYLFIHERSSQTSRRRLQRRHRRDVIRNIMSVK